MSGESLRGQTALITGAAKRLGREIALALASEGADIAIHYRKSKAEAEKVAEEVVALGSKAWLYEADLESADACEALVRKTLEGSSALQILVNNASSFAASTLEKLDFEGLMSEMRTNAWVPFALSREFARQAGRGKIVNMLDTRIVGYDWTHAGYILSKHVLAVLTRMTAYEYAPAVTVNAVAPGLIMPPPGKTEDYLERLGNRLPLKRRGFPRNIVDAILYLVKSDFVTGQVIYVDGGRHLREGGDGSNFSY